MIFQIFKLNKKLGKSVKIKRSYSYAKKIQKIHKHKNRKFLKEFMAKINFFKRI